VKSEISVANELKAYGVSVFLPMRMRLVRHRDKRVRKWVVLFPRYLFVNLQKDTNWLPVMSAAGIISLLCNDGRPVRIEASLIASLQDAEISWPYDQGSEYVPDYRVELLRQLLKCDEVAEFRLDGLTYIG
jgi:hypothetical protein